MSSKILIIAGMHRSGTSLVAQWLYRCGLHLGDTFLGPDITNADGHFEDADFVQLHESLLEHMGLPSSGLTDVYIQHIPKEQTERIRDLVNSKSVQHDAFGWKDPRTCLFLQEYRQLFPEAYYLVVVRNFSAVVHSLVSRIYRWKDQKHRAKGGLDLFLWNLRKGLKRQYLYSRHSTDFLKAWVAYNRALMKHMKNIPASRYMVVHYTSLLQHHKNVIDRMQQSWYFPVHYVDFNQVYKKELIGDPMDVTRYIRNKALMREAQQLEKELMECAGQQYCSV